MSATPDMQTDLTATSHEGQIFVDAVTKRFDDVTAVNAVSIQIPGGEFFSMLGPSGCGKTTTLRMIAGFEMPDEGRIVLQGRDVTSVPPAKRNVNMVFQAYGLFPHMTVAENIAFGPKIKKLSKAEITERMSDVIHTVRLEGLEDRRPTQLSGGQQQRVALARALINRPAALLLDEPLGALDLKLRKEMQLELKRVHREVGITFIYVTHDQEEALTMSDLIAVMDSGRIVQLAPPRDVYDRPRTTFVANFVGVSNLLGGVVRESAGGRATIEVEGGWSFGKTLARPPAAGERVLVAVRPEKLRVSKNGQGLRGQLEDFVYLGSRATLVIRLEGDRLLQVEDSAAVLENSTGRVGQPIAVEWSDADCVVFDEPHGERLE